MAVLSTALRRLRTRRRPSQSTTLDSPERDPHSPRLIACDPSPLSTAELHERQFSDDTEAIREQGEGTDDAGELQDSPDQEEEEVNPDSWPYPPLACSSPAPTPPTRTSLIPVSPAQSDSPLSSPCDSQLSLVPSPHTSSSSLSSAIPASAPALGLTISTRLDSHGHRVLTSRRRLSVAPSPTKCRKNKAAYGVGDGDSEGALDSDDDETEVVRFDGAEDEQADLTGLEKAPFSLPLRLAPTSVPLDYVSTLSFVAADDLTPVSSRLSLDPATPKLSPVSPRQIRPPRPSPPHLRPLSLPTTSLSLRLSPTSTPEHQPIKVFTPPPPLYPSSPNRSTFAAHFTRSNTLVHTSSSSSNSSNAGNSSASNCLSLHSRKTLKRLSRHSVSYPSPSSAATLPIEPPALSTHISRRRSSSIAPLTPLERQTSVSSGSYSASSPSMPPTPGSSGCSHEPFFLHSPPVPPAEPVSTLAFEADSKPSQFERPSTPPRRPSVVSFELPPESPTELLRRERPTSHDYSKRPSSSPTRTRGHRRALSEGQAVGLGLDLHPSWRNDTASMLAEEQWERGKLVVINPDVPLVPIPCYHKPLRAPPRPPRSTKRPSYSPRTPPRPNLEIGLAC
ncbi:Proteophosphoglycan ppg4 [Rhodotorula toruloides ATCC 204091]|uniref:Proteophosphoglycan ppg4 n=1 Tax=Rhodotorula toruloides TaxID=5286 RepID=A0A0K3CAP8_RHOTO|nr:Proteophosphoglycan ppg4 [Rhodotorula toruloides ATCC 204091]PRQ75746.1 Proteophosphoglycan ppg4 [Rhodotorula toruloides]